MEETDDPEPLGDRLLVGSLRFWTTDPPVGGRWRGGALDLSGLGRLVNGLLAATDCGGFLEIGKYGSSALHLAG